MNLSEVNSTFPALADEGYAQKIRDLLHNTNAKIAVIDDDPTGIQTVHNCPLITSWSDQAVERALNDRSDVFYVLTNSRSLTEGEAVRRQTEAVSAILKVNRGTGKTLHFVSRSDSTLRGHFPAEPENIVAALRRQNLPIVSPTIFVPAFFEAGRHTVNDIHYVAHGDTLIPAGETEFARDSVFGYASSNLRNYVVEKSDGSISQSQISSIDLSMIRGSSVEIIANEIARASAKRYLIANVVDYTDLRKFCLSALKLSLRSSASLVVRSSSSLVKALCGLEDRALLTSAELLHGEDSLPGIIIVGSHVDKTSRQLSHLLTEPSTVGIEIDVNAFISQNRPSLSKVLSTLSEIAQTGKTPVVYTSRTEVKPESDAQRLMLGSEVSSFLANLIKDLPFHPRFIISKGGITSHHILERGLDVATAMVKGQILDGVPAVVMQNDHRWPGVPLIIFPGNVGDDTALSMALRKLGHSDTK